MKKKHNLSQGQPSGILTVNCPTILYTCKSRHVTIRRRLQGPSSSHVVWHMEQIAEESGAFHSEFRETGPNPILNLHTFDSKGRSFKRGSWMVAEILVLIKARMEEKERDAQALSNAKRARERWEWIEDRCWSLNVHRSAYQCHDKWQALSLEFKRISENERNAACGGVRSYWLMNMDEKRANRLPRNFHKEIYDAMIEWHAKNRAVSSGELVVDTSSTPIWRVLNGSNATHAAGSSADHSESECEENSGEGQGRKRKAFTKVAEGLGHILQINNKNILDALKECETMREKRHKEEMALERSRLEFEKEKLTRTLQLGEAFLSALNNIGDSLRAATSGLRNHEVSERLDAL